MIRHASPISHYHALLYFSRRRLRFSFLVVRFRPIHWQYILACNIARWLIASLSTFITFRAPLPVSPLPFHKIPYHILPHAHHTHHQLSFTTRQFHWRVMRLSPPPTRPTISFLSALMLTIFILRYLLYLLSLLYKFSLDCHIFLLSVNSITDDFSIFRAECCCL